MFVIPAEAGIQKVDYPGFPFTREWQKVIQAWPHRVNKTW